MGAFGILVIIALLIILVFLTYWIYVSLLDAKAMRKKLERFDDRLDAVQRHRESCFTTHDHQNRSENDNE